MNFYRAQDQARRSSKLLFLLFIVVNLGLICLINLLFAWYLWVNADPLQSTDTLFLDYLNWQRFLIVTSAVALLLLFASWLKWLDIRQGGGRVAELMGGERVLHTMPDRSVRQLLNIVEEMALASGVPVPPVYVMRREQGINAFAAGQGLKDAAICVTRGAIDKLSRDQLQGVIAHEFSHILNGDMRLNMRLLVILHGMIFFGELGRDFLSSRTSWWVDSTRSKSASRGSLILLGLGLTLIGWLGVILGDLIKAAISRQREFLADASAVQFTRNPEGISGALKVIAAQHGGGFISHPGSQEASHLFFSQVSSGSWWASHPPLDIRIRKIDPHWDGSYPEASIPVESPEPVEKGKPKQEVIDGLIGTLATAELLDHAVTQESVVASVDRIEDQLIDLARDPYSARVLLLGLLLDTDGDIRELQLDLIADEEAGLKQQIDQYGEVIASQPRESHLQLIELSLPALKALSQVQYRRFKRLLIRVVQADSKIDLFEWTLYQLVSRFCDAHFGIHRDKQNRYTAIAQLADDYVVVLSTLAHFGSPDLKEAARAFNLGAGSAGLYNHRLLDKAQCQREHFSAAVSELAAATPFIKQRLLRGMIRLIQHDGRIVAMERELITAIAAVIESPLIGLDD